jgi:hypothetical protein
VWSGLALGLAAGGCHRAFSCEEDEQCQLGGVQGACEGNGYCSFPDESCPSGWSFGEHASAPLAGTCVDEPAAGSGSGSGPGSDSSSMTTTSGATSLELDGTSSSSSSDGPIIDTEFDPCEGLVESGPVKAEANGQVIEGLRITVASGPGIEVESLTGVTIRNCEIHHYDGPGISFRDADGLVIEDVVVVHDGAPMTGPHADGDQANVEGSDSAMVTLSRVRASQGSSGIDLETISDLHLSFIEVHDVRGPGAAACVRLFDSDDAVLEDFSCENPLDTGRPGDLVAVDHSSRVEVRRGLLDGHNSEFGYGVHFIQISGQTLGGLVEDVDAVRMTNGAFSCFSFGDEITFRRTRARENICEIVSVRIPDCQVTGPTNGCVPGSNGIEWTASNSSGEIVIEDSTYFDLCNNPTWPSDAFTIGRGDLVEEDFELRPPIRLEPCWEP